MRDSVAQKVNVGANISAATLRAYTQGSLNYFVAEWRKSDTLSYFLQWNTSGDLGLYKNENGTTTRIKSL